MKTLAWPDTVAVAPGESGLISVAVTNSSSVIDAYRVQVFGLDPSWVEIEPARLSLFPGETANVAVNLRLPADYPASQRTLTVNVASDDDPGSFALNQIELAVQPKTKTSLHMDPVMITAGRRATFGMVIGNEGNAPVTATAYAVDPEDLAEFTFDPLEVVVAPGREQVIQVTAERGRSWFGPPRPRTFTFGVEAETHVEAMATFIQRPRIGRWMLTLLGLLTAAAVFAAVLSRSFDRVVEEAKVSTGVIDAALSTGGAGGAVVPANPGTVRGTLVSRTTGTGFSGATAELYVEGDDTTVVSSAATDDDGAFTFSNLGAGTYLLQLSGSGVNQIWYGNTATADGSTPIEVELGEITLLEPIEIGGIPVPVEGVVAIDDPSGTTITLLAPGQSDPSAPGVVATVEVGPDGVFVLPDIPSPGQYEMVISKPGFATETRAVVLQPGQGLGDIEITLRPGNGVITGTVSAPGRPLGGATVIATDGTNRVETVSLTEGDVGSFTLRDLAVPGQYTVTISAPSFSTEARTVALETSAPNADFGVQLIPATGSVTGRALVNGAPARGLTVNITGGDINRTTAVVSQGTCCWHVFVLQSSRTAHLHPHVLRRRHDPTGSSRRSRPVGRHPEPDGGRRQLVAGANYRWRRGAGRGRDSCIAGDGELDRRRGRIGDAHRRRAGKGTFPVRQHRTRGLHAHRQPDRHRTGRHSGQHLGVESRTRPHRATRSAGQRVGPSGRHERVGPAVHDEVVRDGALPGHAETGHDH